eukprot:PLAT2778.1.p1 GENE.PLAT2778.1~~PLAT2778.1.p1  ORF type:complete len:141 (+),score=27.78 PLAT2778.1:9-431(+)
MNSTTPTGNDAPEQIVPGLTVAGLIVTIIVVFLLLGITIACYRLFFSAAAKERMAREAQERAVAMGAAPAGAAPVGTAPLAASASVATSAPSAELAALPSGWYATSDAATGGTYYVNSSTGETSWTLPAGASSAPATAAV